MKKVKQGSGIDTKEAKEHITNFLKSQAGVINTCDNINLLVETLDTLEKLSELCNLRIKSLSSVAEIQTISDKFIQGSTPYKS